MDLCSSAKRSNCLSTMQGQGKTVPFDLQKIFRQLKQIWYSWALLLALSKMSLLLHHTVKTWVIAFEFTASRDVEILIWKYLRITVFVFGSHPVYVLTCHLPEFKICEPIVSLCDWLGKLSHVRFNETPNFKHNRDTACSKIAICTTIKYSNVLTLSQHFNNWIC